MNRPAQKPRGVKCAWILWTACSMGIGALINNSLNLFQSTALQPTPDAPAGAPPVAPCRKDGYGTWQFNALKEILKAATSLDVKTAHSDGDSADFDACLAAPPCLLKTHAARRDSCRLHEPPGPAGRAAEQHADVRSCLGFGPEGLHSRDAAGSAAAHDVAPRFQQYAKWVPFACYDMAYERMYGDRPGEVDRLAAALAPRWLRAGGDVLGGPPGGCAPRAPEVLYVRDAPLRDVEGADGRALRLVEWLCGAGHEVTLVSRGHAKGYRESGAPPAPASGRIFLPRSKSSRACSVAVKSDDELLGRVLTSSFLAAKQFDLALLEVNFDERFGDEPAARRAAPFDARTPPRRVAVVSHALHYHALAELGRGDDQGTRRAAAAYGHERLLYASARRRGPRADGGARRGRRDAALDASLLDALRLAVRLDDAGAPWGEA
ncbi:hypothetical protein JL721_3424 [Aureococcus anophagefferens]|nr:hypothetical protein JL721_3424 [Aureococcus anophagefferens]